MHFFQLQQSKYISFVEIRLCFNNKIRLFRMSPISSSSSSSSRLRSVKLIILSNLDPGVYPPYFEISTFKSGKYLPKTFTKVVKNAKDIILKLFCAKDNKANISIWFSYTRFFFQILHLFLRVSNLPHDFKIFLYKLCYYIKHTRYMLAFESIKSFFFF